MINCHRKYYYDSVSVCLFWMHWKVKKQSITTDLKCVTLSFTVDSRIEKKESINVFMIIF